MFDSIVDPTAGSDVGQREGDQMTLAPRPTTLEGLRLGLLANTKRNAVEFLEEVASFLREQHGVRPVLARTKTSITHPVSDDMLSELRAACDVVVTGVGDCGSCSASAVADGILFEQSGVPAAVICTDAFTVSADAMAEVQGSPGYRYVTTDHPVASLEREGVRARAEKVVPQIVTVLTGAPAEGA